MRKKADTESDYLDTHRGELQPVVQDFLVKGGLYWDIQILERDSMEILQQAILRLRQIEK